MNITFLTQWFDPEPGALRGLPLASWLHNRGHSVEVITSVPNYPEGHIYPGFRMRLHQTQVMQGVPVHRLPLYPSHDGSAVKRVMNYASFALSAATVGSVVIPKATEVVYVYHPPPTVGAAALLWQRTRSVPFVYHIADMWPESVTESGMISSPRIRAAADRAISAWCRRLYNRASAITVLSPGFKRLLIERGVPEEKVQVIYNWADETIFRPQARDEERARRFGLDSRFRVMYAGNLGPFQGLDTAIRAVARLKALDIELVIVGTGQSEAALRSLAADVAPNNVRFVGRQPYGEMGQVMSLADVLLVSLRDLDFFASTIPSKTQASLAVGRPVLMSARGDAADVITASGGGIVCAPGSDVALAEAIQHLSELSNDEREAMGARGRAYYEERLSLASGGRSMEELFRLVTAGRHATVGVAKPS